MHIVSDWYILSMGRELWLCVLFVAGMVSNFQSLTMNINIVTAVIGKIHTFTCAVSTATNITVWTYLNGSVGSVTLKYQNGACKTSPTGIFSSDRYSFACNNIEYNVTLRNIGGIDKTILNCRDGLRAEELGTSWYLYRIVDDFDADEICNCEPPIEFTVGDATEGENITFICRVSSSVAFVNWNWLRGSKTAAMGVGLNGRCNTTSGATFLDDNSKYIYTCNRTGYQVTRLNVQISEHNNMYMCTPSGQTEGTGSNWIVKVKAPVKSVTLTPSKYLANVKEYTAVELTCTSSTARPAASVYWYRHPNGNSNDINWIMDNITTTTDYNDLSITTSILRFVPTRQDNNVKIFCEASNSVNSGPVKSSSDILLNVLFPPTVARMKNISKHIGEELKMNCLYTAGVPAQTSTRWTREKDIKKWDGEQLYISSLKRSDAGYYYCNASNVMTPSGDSKSYIGHSTQSFYLDVFYDANITSFAIHSFTKHVVTVNENDPLRSICNADSNPEAIMTLVHDSKPLKTTTSNTLEYNIDKGTCSDAGLYICYAMNAYNSVISSVDFVQLFVTCRPRAAKDVDIDIKSDTGIPITIAVDVIAFPPPSFKWYKLVNGTWTLLKENGIYSMTSSGVQSNLTILSVGVDDFTSYKVNVENDHGLFEQYYSMTPYDKPNPPINFRYIEGHTTISSIHLEWEPGFDGGLSQTFYIKYKKSSDSYWKYVKVSDNEEQKMELSLTELTEVTQYDIVTFASNRVGNSSESQKLIAVTKGECSCTSPGLLIGGIISLTVGIAVLVAVGVFVFRRNGFINACSSKPAIKTGKDNGINNAAEETSYNTIASVPEYEMIDQRNNESNQRSSLEQIQLTAASGNRSDERKDTYENLKVEVF